MPLALPPHSKNPGDAHAAGGSYREERRQEKPNLR